jgi:hypothetical protein
MRIVLYSLLIIITACQSPKDVVQAQATEQQSEEITINNHTLKGDILSLNITYSGCKKDTFTLLSSGMYKKTNPPSLMLKLVKEPSAKMCANSITKTIKFSLINTRYGDGSQKNTLILRVKSYSSDIEYIY